MFMGPLEAVKPWQTAQVAGVVRFRDRIYAMVISHTTEKSEKPATITSEIRNKLTREMHKTIQKVTEDIENLSFNTAISAMMIFLNEISTACRDCEVPVEYLKTLVLLVSPFAPHLAEECWELLGNKESLAYHAWPVYDPSLCVPDSSAKIAVQVNGKVRGVIEVDMNFPEAEIIELAMERVARYVTGYDVKKTIYVKNKIVNIVLKR